MSAASQSGVFYPHESAMERTSEQESQCYGKMSRLTFPLLRQGISVSVLPNTEKTYAVMIWKSSTAGSMALLPTGWFDGRCLPFRKLLACDMLEYLVYFSNACFCYTLPGLLTFYAWTWYFYPSLYSIFSLLSFSCLHPSSSLVREFFSCYSSG